MACKLESQQLHYPSRARADDAHRQIETSHIAVLLALAEEAADNGIDDLAEQLIDQAFAKVEADLQHLWSVSDAEVLYQIPG